MNDLIENWYKQEKGETAEYTESKYRLQYVWWLEFKLVDAANLMEKIITAHEQGCVDMDAINKAQKFIDGE